jgi:hypothetical protein
MISNQRKRFEINMSSLSNLSGDFATLWFCTVEDRIRADFQRRLILCRQRTPQAATPAECQPLRRLRKQWLSRESGWQDFSLAASKNLNVLEEKLASCRPIMCLLHNW